MTARPPTLPQRPDVRCPAQRLPAEADILSDVLRTVRLSGALFFDVRASSPWVAETPPAAELASMVMPGAQHVIEYHVVVAGECWAGLTETGAEPVRLTQGSVAVFPQGDPHVFSSAPRMRAAAQATADPALYLPRLDRAMPFVVEQQGGGPEKTRLLCGFLGCDARPFNPLIQALPRMLHIPGCYSKKSGKLGFLIGAIIEESRDGRIGGGGILAKLSELIFLEVVRLHAESLADGARGWLAGLGDPQVGRAIRLLHGDPGRPWTLPDLAREAGVSRTILAERFTAALGMPPMTYLLNWRMQIAAGMLTCGEAKIAGVAADVGYESEAAFSRAFKRSTGMPPAAWRMAARERAPSGRVA
ncbi:AraC family transcriptional regulator [Inquilinus sp. CAU 1745]|uniref:AraC family transcriptional regulator n=1 Tax=Inquilinus sp. CAU 1745 TaxID=3140369 RepID=UPI00325AD5D8